MARKVECILNGSAGSGRVAEAEALIARVAGEHGGQARVRVAGSGAELARLVREVGEADVVAAGGGDGTMGLVASTLVGGESALGVLPMGTLNHFAKDLAIPLDLEAAVRVLFTGRVGRVDVGEVNGRVFLNNSSIGLYPQIVRLRERQQREGRGKWPAFVRAAVQALRRGATMRVELSTPEESAALHKVPFLFVGNNRYATEGLELGTRGRVDGGSLFVCAAPRTGRVQLMGLAVAALLGRMGTGALTEFDTTELCVRTRRRRIDVATDGEVSVMRTPLLYRTRPGALRVVLPE